VTVQSTAYLDAITCLPAGGRLIVYDIRWEEYEQILAHLRDSSHFRISYDQGRLEIMTPSARHEKYKNLLHDLVLILSDELDREILSYGSTTLSLKRRGKGVEGDDCFYIEHASNLGEKDQIDLTRDPPPDLVIEIDLTHESSSKLAIYAELGVPEIWRFDGNKCQIWQLIEQAYIPAAFSLAFPFLAGEDLAEFVTNSETQGRKQARHAFRAWVRKTKSSTT
jgi:Uma2 family endonuclease